MSNGYSSTSQSDETIGNASQSGGYDGSTGQQQAQYGSDVEGDLGGGAVKTQGFVMPAVAADTSAGALAALRGEGTVLVEEATGEPPSVSYTGESGVESTVLHEMLSNSGQETETEYAEASAEQLATPMEQVEAEVPFETAPAQGETIEAEVGSAVAGWTENTAQQEFLPLLTALVPTLLSTIGPAVAKKVVSRLSARTRKGVKGLAGMAAQLGKVTGPAKHLALFARLLETKVQLPSGPGAESQGAEIDTLVQEAAAAMEVIIGTDDRVRITNTTAEPWRKICLLRITFPSGRTYRGTGFMIGKRAVATAGHCVYLQSEGGWAKKIEVIPGANGGSCPYGKCDATTFRSVRGWVQFKQPECDYGCVVLPADAFGGQPLGAFGILEIPDVHTMLARPAVVAGYAGDKPLELWGMQRRIKTVTAKTLIYDIDTKGGQSGAPVYIKVNDKRYLIGIHNYGDAAGNSATRVTPQVAKRLAEWNKI